MIDFGTHFLKIVIEAAPFLLLGTVVSGLIEVFISREDLARLIPRHPVLAALAGGLMGFAFPVGECGVVPVMRRLTHKGLPVPAGIAFLLAAPVINPIAIAITYAAFHERAVELVALRVIVVWVVAASIGIVFAFQKRPDRLLRESVPAVAPKKTALGPGLKRSLSLAGREFLDLGRYLILGALLAASVQVVVSQNDLEALATSPARSVWVMQALAFILSPGSATDAFVAVDWADAFPLGAVLGFLTFGPMVDIKNIVLFLGVFRRRAVLYLILLVFLLTTLIALGITTSSAIDFREPSGDGLSGVVYLAPSDEAQRYLYLADLDTGKVSQLTTDEHGIEDYAVSPNGRQIAYTRINADGSGDLWLLDLRTQTTRQITNCISAMCHAPAWKPDGTQIAYQREEFGGGMNNARVWIVDLDTVQTQLLFSDAQMLGAQPTWAPDGDRIAVFDPDLPGIRIHTFATGEDATIENVQGVVGHFSPDGTQLVYPILTRGQIGQQFYTHLEMVDLSTETRTRLSGEEDTPVEDGEGVWSPDGQTMLSTRRYLDDRFTAGKQIYLLDLATGEAEPLIVDASYNHSTMRWDVSGRRIVFQRFSLVDPDALPEIWVYDFETDDLTQIASNAYLPGWAP